MWGLYLDPPENAVVIGVDEKPAIQVLERAQGWLRLPDGQALRGFSHEYKRHGSTTMFAALEIATEMVRVGHYPRRRRREFLDFMNQIVASYPDQELHVVLDNLNTHKPKHDRWLARHPLVHFHYPPQPMPRGSTRSSVGSAYCGAKPSEDSVSPQSKQSAKQSTHSLMPTRKALTLSNGPRPLFILTNLKLNTLIYATKD